MKTYRLDEFDAESFDPEGARGEITVDFKEFLYDPTRKKGMAKVYVGEDDVHQTAWIEIVHTGKDWLIRPTQGGGAIPTAGLQRAIDLVHEAARK